MAAEQLELIESSGKETLEGDRRIVVNVGERDMKRLCALAKACNMSVERMLLENALERVPKYPEALVILFDEMVALGQRLKAVIERLDGGEKVDASAVLERATELMDIIWNMIERKSGF